MVWVTVRGHAHDSRRSFGRRRAGRGDGLPAGPRELLSLVGHGHLVAVDAPEEMAAALELALRQPKPAPSVEIQERFGATNVAERYLRALGLGVGSLA